MSYTPISCQDYDLLELFVTRRIKVDLVFNDSGVISKKMGVLIKDVFTREKTEYLVDEHQQQIRLDAILMINDHLFAPADYFQPQKEKFLQRIEDTTPYPVMGFLFDDKKAKPIDLSSKNDELKQVDPDNEKMFHDFVFNQANKEQILYGGYGEKRTFYQRSEIFKNQTEARNTHLGIDVWGEDLLPVYSPLDGEYFGVYDNAGKGNYGPTLIVKHQIGNLDFFTLYGHLSLNSLKGKREGAVIKKGEQIGTLGTYKENGHWPPHLHFQVMLDMLGNKHDFIGVCFESYREFFLNLCPNPMIFLSPKSN